MEIQRHRQHLKGWRLSLQIISGGKFLAETELETNIHIPMNGSASVYQCTPIEKSQWSGKLENDFDFEPS
jgi:hypothetical protein